MDKLRTTLIVSLAVVGYFLILAWNEDYGQEPQVILEQTPESQEQMELAVTSVNETANSSFDTLETPEEQSATSLTPELSAPETDTAQIITVSTDILRLQIDLKGGQVVGADLLDYPISLNNPNPLPLLSSGLPRYFVAESALIGANGPDNPKNGGTLVFQTPRASYAMSEDQDTLTVTLQAERQGVRYEKMFTFKRGQYAVDVNYRVTNQGEQAWKGNFAAKFVRDRSADPTKGSGFGAVSFLGAVLSVPEAPYEKYDFSDMEEGPIKATTDKGWVAFNQHYFLSAWVPSAERSRVLQTRLKDGRFLMGYVDSQVEVAPGETSDIGASLYLGPKIMDNLEKVHPDLALTVDFGILWLVAKPLFLILDFIQDYVVNWGVAIILLTVLIKAVFFHLSAASYRSMANMRRVAPELTRIRETYGDDRQKMSQAMMDLYRKEKINPLGGCLPILVQMPVFIALYWVLLESVELRQAPFFGWIQDLSIKDPYFILPLLMGASMFVQMRLNPAPPDPVQARVMQLMPIIFTVFFLWFPAGLVLYWLVNNLLSIAQQWVITRQIESAGKPG